MRPPSLNRATLIGLVSNSPEAAEPPVRSSGQAKRRWCSFSVQTFESWVDKGTGQVVETSQFHRIVVKNAVLAELALKRLSTGAHVMVEGTLEIRSFQDPAGTTKFITEVVLGAVGAKLLLLGSEEQRKSKAAQEQVADAGAYS